MRTIALITVFITGSLLFYAVGDFPAWGDPHSPASEYRVSQHYITKIFEETSVPNFVTAVLADYRGYDTMFETVVIFTGGIAIIAILTLIPPRKENIKPEPDDFTDVIVDTTCRLLVPVIQLFALYVIAHGHHSPGGGFQGGVIFGASLILLAITRDLGAALKRLSAKRFVILGAVGVLIYAGFGLACVLLGENFLDYHILHKIMPATPIEARSHSMLGVEIGVGFTVTSIMFGIYANLATRGKLKGGL